MEVLDSIWAFIKKMFGSFDNFLEELVDFDKLAIDFYNNVIMPFPEWVKILGTIGLAIVVVFGILSIAKKMMKLLILVVVILAIVVLARIFLMS